MSIPPVPAPSTRQRDLVTAVLRDHPQDLLLALEEGADPNLADERGTTPLHLAAEHASHRCAALLAPISDPTARDRLGRTPLHLAARRGATLTVGILLPFSDPEAADDDGRTPLMAAALNNRTACVGLLLPNSSAGRTDRDGTPVHLMPRRPSCRILLEREALFHGAAPHVPPKPKPSL